MFFRVKIIQLKKKNRRKMKKMRINKPLKVVSMLRRKKIIKR